MIPQCLLFIFPGLFSVAVGRRIANSTLARQPLEVVGELRQNCPRQCSWRVYNDEGKINFNHKWAFLSGVHMQPPWISYGAVFGDGRSKDGPNGRIHNMLYGVLSDVVAAGGNSVRVWTLFEGESLVCNASGQCWNVASGHTFAEELGDFVDAAMERGIVVIVNLWNFGATNNAATWKLEGLVLDEAKLDYFIREALVPKIVAPLKDRKNIIWEIANEPEGAVLAKRDAEPCYDTSYWGNSGWHPKKFNMRDMLRFLSKQIAAIRLAANCQLVTVGSWNMKANSVQWDGLAKAGFNHYSDSCLRKAGGQYHGILDFYQTHSYDNEIGNGRYRYQQPFSKGSFANYDFGGSKKPLLVGEFSQMQHDDAARRIPGWTACRQYTQLVDWGYSGAIYWALKGLDYEQENAKDGMRCVRDDSKAKGLRDELLACR